MTNIDALGRLIPLRRAVIIGTVSLAALAGLYFVASVTLHTFVGADVLESKLNRSLPEGMEEMYRVEVDAARWSLWRRSLQAGPIALYPTGGADTTSPHYVASASHVQLNGVGLWALLWEGAVSLDEVVLLRPLLRLTVDGRAPSTSAEETNVSKTIRRIVDRRLPPIRIRRMRIQEGAMVVLTERHGDPSPIVSHFLRGVSLRATGIRTDSSAQGPHHILLSDRMQASIRGYRAVSEDSLYAATVGPASVSSSDSSLIAEHIIVEPTVSDATFMHRRGHRSNRVSASIRHLTVEGWNVRRFLEDRSFIAKSAVLDSFRVDVYRNNHLPPLEVDPPPKMPNELMRNLDQTVRIDTVRVLKGVARYAKWDEEASDPGQISFEEIHATLRNVTNDPRRMSRSKPAIVDVRTQVAGAGRLNATIRMPLLSPHLSLTYQGQLGPMDPRAFNDAFVNLSGIRIEGGRVDSLWFYADVDRGKAQGTVHGIYRDLEVEMIDTWTGERGLGKRIRTFVLDDVLLKSNNTPSESPLRTGTIEHERESGDTVFKFLWHSLRSGIYSLVGL